MTNGLQKQHPEDLHEHSIPPRQDGRQRVIIERLRPTVNDGRYPVKRVPGEPVHVRADIFSDGHDSLRAVVLYRSKNRAEWTEVEMTGGVNDRWEATFTIEALCDYEFTVEAWVDHFGSWQKDIGKKYDAGQDISVDLLTGARLAEETAARTDGEDRAALTSCAASLREGDNDFRFAIARGAELTALMRRNPDRRLASRADRVLTITVDRPKALFSSWYELFPRSADGGGHGTFTDCVRRIPDIAAMGFDVLYLPPIHPVGETNRKGKNNAPRAAQDDPGSPWAIGSRAGGHKAVNPALGTMEDFRRLIETAGAHDIDIAIDIAFQCSPDHPYITEHPEWFRRRPDGTIQYAENPPKKYEDVVPLDFECDDWRALWEELASVMLFWAQQGVRIFRVDNPHTKPFSFWEWCIARVKSEFPDAIFLAEAFTRPKVMHRLAKVGFTQSYTYYTWRNTKQELTSYLLELTRSDIREFFRPNFWPNTPDILPEYLQYGGRPAFIVRFVLAATLSSNYGIYGPVFELCVNRGVADREEYHDSEKYEIKKWDLDQPGSIREIITLINTARRENPALANTWNVEFLDVDNEYVIAFLKWNDDGSNHVLVVANLDPYHTQSGWIHLPARLLGIASSQSYLVADVISRDTYIWQGENNYVELNPAVIPVHVFRIHRRLRRETDFDYYL